MNTDRNEIMNVPETVLDLPFSDGRVLSHHIAGTEPVVDELIERSQFCETWRLRLEMCGHNPVVHRTATQILAFIREAGQALVRIYLWPQLGIGVMYNVEADTALLVSECLWKPSERSAPLAV